jgi:hypothetical protein
MNGLQEKPQSDAQELTANPDDGIFWAGMYFRMAGLDEKWLRLYESERLSRSTPCDVFEFRGFHWVKI